MENEYYESGKRGHGGLALLFGILSILIIIFAGILFGMFGIIPAAILGVLAIVLGITSIRSTRGRSGKGGVITGAIGILFALIVGGFVLSLGTYLKSEDVSSRIPTISAYAGETWRGIVGLYLKMDADGVDIDKMNEEINQFTGSKEAQKPVSTEAGN